MNRMKTFKGTKISTRGEAIALAAEFTDGKEGMIEVMVDDAPMLVDVVIAASEALARAQPTSKAIEEGMPGDGSLRVIPLPTTNLHVVSKDDASVALYMRAGLVDLLLKFDAAAAKALASQLVRMTR